MRGTGFARHAVPRNLRRFRKSVLYHAYEHRGYLRGGTRRNDLFLISVFIPPNNVCVWKGAVVCERGERPCNLQGRHFNSLSKGSGGKVYFVSLPEFRVPREYFSCELYVCGLKKIEGLSILQKLLVPELALCEHGSRIDGILKHFGHSSFSPHPLIVVGNFSRANLHESPISVRCIRSYRSFVEGRSHGEGLKHGSRFVDFLDCGILKHSHILHLCVCVGIKGRSIGKGKNFAGSRIHNYNSAPLYLQARFRSFQKRFRD